MIDSSVFRCEGGVLNSDYFGRSVNGFCKSLRIEKGSRFEAESNVSIVGGHMIPIGEEEGE